MTITAAERFARRMGEVDPDAQTETEYRREMEMRNRPWTDADYEKLREAALALVHSREDGGENRTVVSGREFYRLLGALDRDGQQW